MDNINIYCDGACLSNGAENGGIGGWAFLAFDADDFKEFIRLTGNESNTTNNRMELTAIARALQWTTQLNVTDTVFTIFSDSAYVMNCFLQKWYVNWQNNNWQTSKCMPVLNQDLWEEIIPFFENPRYSFKKVKGHSDNPFNNIVDILASGAARNLKLSSIITKI